MAISALCLLIAFSGSSSGQPPEPWASKLFGPPANRFHDFGPVSKGRLLRHDFVLTNIYSVPMEITQVRVPMGGVTRTDIAKKTLQPNEKATISVTMDTGRFTGQKTVAIFVTFGPKWVSETALYCTVVSVDSDIAERNAPPDLGRNSGFARFAVRCSGAGR
jgi:hypothetical protein